MSSPVGRTRKSPAIDPRLLAAINRLLIAGMKLGPAGKHDAINKVLQLVPEWTRGHCWRRMRQLRKTFEVAGSREGPSCDELQESGQTDSMPRSLSRRWTAGDDDKLLNWAGYEPVKKIAQRLGRSERAVRFRMAALSMSAKVTDGWSQRALRTLLRVSPARHRYWIGRGMLRVRDARVSMWSLAAYCERNRTSLDQTAMERITTAVRRGDEACSWERAADLLGTPVEQVQDLICSSKLSVRDPFVTDRSLEEFCRRHGHEINMALIDPATRKWLTSEYGVPEAGNGEIVPRAQKHVLVIRECKCGRKIAGNVYFRHAKACKVAAGQAMRQAVYESSACGETLTGSV